jgi:tetratricopeptide (TPR) repeat protein
MTGSKIPPGGSFANPVHARLAEAERLRQAGRKSESEAICRAVLKFHRSAPALAMLALLLWDKNELAEAEALMARASELEPRAPVLLGHLAGLRFQLGDIAGAEKTYARAVGLNAGDWELFHNLGIARAALGRFEEALAAQRRALGLKPGHPPILVQAGFLLHQLGDHDAALPLLTAACVPGYFDAHYYRGVVLAALGRFDEAAAAQRQAIAIAPKRFEGHLALGNACAQTGQEQQALAAYRDAIAANPSYLPAHKLFNDLAWMLGQDVRDANSYDFARAQVGDAPDLLLAQAELKLRFADAAGAVALLEKIEDNSRADVAEATGRALDLLGRAEDSEAAFTRAIAGAPDKLDFRHAYAESLLRRGALAPALDLVRATLDLAPRDQIALAHRLLLARLAGDDDTLRRLEARDFVQEIILPVPAGFADAQGFNAALAQDLAQLHTSRNAPMDQTLHGGTQTAGALFGRPSRPLALLEDSIRRAVGDYIKALPQDAAHPFLGRKSEAFDFAGSWSCRLFSSGFHHNHVHAQGWISSAYYAALPDTVAQAEGGQGALAFGQSRFHLGERDQPFRTVTPGIGKLVLFPSYFWHGTVPFASDRARLSVAFDVVPR